MVHTRFNANIGGEIMKTNIETEFVKTKKFRVKGGDVVEFRILVNDELVFLADKKLAYEADYPYTFLDSDPQKLFVPMNEDWEFKIKFIRHTSIKSWMIK